MSISNFLKTEKGKYNWGKISVLITIIVFLIALSPTLYQILHEEEPDISFKIMSKSNVFDVHEPLEDLIILFNGEDIQKNNQNLLIFTIRIENSGNVDILQSQYDQNIPWGFDIENGDIIRMRLQYSSSEYILSNLNPKITKENNIEFEKIIFEKGEFFDVDVFVLHDKSILPSIIPFGKIAGIKTFKIINIWQKGEELLSIDEKIKLITGSAIFISLILIIFTHFITKKIEREKREITVIPSLSPFYPITKKIWEQYQKDTYKNLLKSLEKSELVKQKEKIKKKKGE